MIQVRESTTRDRESIANVYLAAFPDTENSLVASLANEVLSLSGLESRHSVFSLVAEIDMKVVGHIAFSPVTSECDSNWLAFILAPLAVCPEFQKQGIGAALVEKGIELVRTTGANRLFVYGDPAYYSRFGFKPEVATAFPTPYALTYPDGWQGLILQPDTPLTTNASLCFSAPLAKPELW